VVLSSESSDNESSDNESSNSESSGSESSDGGPRRAVRVKRRNVAAESQHRQIETGLIPDPSLAARARARALNAMKKKNVQTSQLEHEFRLPE
jgi:hypothetical protein